MAFYAMMRLEGRSVAIILVLEVDLRLEMERHKDGPKSIGTTSKMMSQTCRSTKPISYQPRMMTWRMIWQRMKKPMRTNISKRIRKMAWG